MLNVVILVSGGGTNLQAIIDAVEAGVITNTKITGVISNNKNAYALERAKKHGISAQCISPKDFETRDRFNEVFLETEQGMLMVKGSDLHVNRLNLEKGEVDLSGTIDSIAYSDVQSAVSRGENIFAKLFR